jgi:hypothetical protein
MFEKKRNNDASSIDDSAMEIPDEEKIKAPYSLLWYHIASKGFHLGSFAGFSLGIPIAVYDRYRFGYPMLTSLVRSTTHASIMGMAAFSVAASYFVHFYYDKNQIEDIAYKVYHNETMYKWESLAWTGTVLGGVVGGIKPRASAFQFSEIPSRRLLSIWRGSAFGCGIAMTAYFVFNFKHTLNHVLTQIEKMEQDEDE